MKKTTLLLAGFLLLGNTSRGVASSREGSIPVEKSDVNRPGYHTQVFVNNDRAYVSSREDNQQFYHAYMRLDTAPYPGKLRIDRGWIQYSGPNGTKRAWTSGPHRGIHTATLDYVDSMNWNANPTRFSYDIITVHPNIPDYNPEELEEM